MKAVFWHSCWPREKALSAAVAAGARRCGDEVELRPSCDATRLADCDLACMVGVKSRELFNQYREAGVPVAFFDKGYVRDLKMLKFWRVAIDGQQPLEYVRQADHNSARWDETRIKLRPWQKRGEAVLIAGSSAKSMQWSGVMDATEWVRDLVGHIKALTDRPIIYRPKPSWRDAERIAGTEFSRDRYGLRDCMKRSHVMVTHSSNACFDAALAGLPAIVVGEGIARPISSTSVSEIEHPRRADADERKQWLANVAWCQFTLSEFSAGSGWRQIRKMVESAA